MQRWIKLPDGRFIDANRIAYVGKVETFTNISGSDTELGLRYTVSLGTDFPRESQTTVIGSKEEIFALLKLLLSGGITPQDKLNNE